MWIVGVRKGWRKSRKVHSLANVRNESPMFRKVRRSCTSPKKPQWSTHVWQSSSELLAQHCPLRRSEISKVTTKERSAKSNETNKLIQSFRDSKGPIGILTPSSSAARGTTCDTDHAHNVVITNICLGRMETLTCMAKCKAPHGSMQSDIVNYPRCPHSVKVR